MKLPMTLLPVLLLLTPPPAEAQVWYGGRQYHSRVCSNPNCSMCAIIENGLRAQRSRSVPVSGFRPQVVRSFSPVTSVVPVPSQPVTLPPPVTTVAVEPPPQVEHSEDSSNPAVVAKALAIARLQPDDVLGELGCGTGRPAIAAVREYGCSVIGFEIDEATAETARRNVALAEQAGDIPAGRITIVTADVLDIDPADYGITVAFAYQFPDVLADFRPMLERVPRAVTVMHQVPGLDMRKFSGGEVWLYEQPAQEPAEPVLVSDRPSEWWGYQ